MGEILFLPWARLTPWPHALRMVQDHGLTVVALTPAAEAEPLEDVLDGTPGPIALLLGAEGPGSRPPRWRRPIAALESRSPPVTTR